MLAQKAFNAARTPPDCSVMHDDSSLKHGEFLTPCEIGAVTGLFFLREGRACFYLKRFYKGEV
jgi:hypothetical protein